MSSCENSTGKYSEDHGKRVGALPRHHLSPECSRKCSCCCECIWLGHSAAAFFISEQQTLPNFPVNFRQHVWKRLPNKISKQTKCQFYHHVLPLACSALADPKERSRNVPVSVSRSDSDNFLLIRHRWKANCLDPIFRKFYIVHVWKHFNTHYIQRNLSLSNKEFFPNPS